MAKASRKTRRHPPEGNPRRERRPPLAISNRSRAGSGDGVEAAVGAVPRAVATLACVGVSEELRDLQQLSAEDAVPLDFVDLAETGEFAPEVMEGECSA